MDNELRSESSVAPNRIEELERTCFVIMPFGKKKVGRKKVDFDAIYKNIFEPAISNVKTPEDEPLIAKRTDMDAFSGAITQEMFEYIMYSRVAFADISGFNPNVFYEIGARHSAQESGTVIFRQTGHGIPFDINTIKIFEYDHEPSDKAKMSCAFITQVLADTLKYNRLDSPVRVALRAQRGVFPGATGVGYAQTAEQPSPPADYPTVSAVSAAEEWNKHLVERFMRDAEEAIRIDDRDMAVNNYWAALRLDPLNVIARMRLGLVLKKRGEHYDALEEFATVTKLAPDYGEAWKEKGVVEGVIARKIPPQERAKSTWLPDGYDSLEKATKLIPNDFDAWSSLGGVLKNVRKEFGAAREMYAHAAKISDGHPYPLLNALKLEALETGKLKLKPVQDQLEKAKKLRLGQTQATPPTDTPWCYFDLAEIHLYQSDKEGFLDFVRKGMESCNANWQRKTFRDSLHDTLVARGIELDGLSEGIALIDKAIKANK